MGNIKGFTFFKSYYESIKNLKEKDKKIIINAMLEYVFENKNPQFSGTNLIIWTLIEPHLRTSKNRSHDNSGAPEGNENACKIKKNEKIENNQKTIKIQSNNNQKTTNDLLEKNKNKNKNKNKKCGRDNIVKQLNEVYSLTPFDTPTTHTQIFDFCSSIFQDCLSSDLEKSCKKFFLHYKSKNWDGIFDWQSKAQEWMQKDIDDGIIRVIDTSRRLD